MSRKVNPIIFGSLPIPASARHLVDKMVALRTRPASSLPLKIQAQLMNEAKYREAEMWKQMKGLCLAKNATRSEIKLTRMLLLDACYRAAEMILEARVEGMHNWDVWMHYIQLAQVETTAKMAG